MRTQKTTSILRPRAFTLIELLVVIAIIGILAALIFPAGKAIKEKATRSRAKNELRIVELAIKSYKAQLGHFPPDNPSDTTTWVNQLYYELVGTTLTNNIYVPVPTAGTNTVSVTEVGALATADFSAFFSPPLKVGGFVNATKGGGEDSPVSRSYLSGLKPAQYLLVQQGGVRGMVLGTIIKGPVMLTDGGDKSINPYRYSVSGPNRHNPDGFDLWVDILVGGKTNRISNWNDGYEIVP